MVRAGVQAAAGARTTDGPWVRHVRRLGGACRQAKRGHLQGAKRRHNRGTVSAGQ